MDAFSRVKPHFFYHFKKKFEFYRINNEESEKPICARNEMNRHTRNVPMNTQ